MKKVKVGVVGLGEVAQITHLPILQALSDKFEIGALCDVSPSLVQWAGERYGVDKLYTDAAELAKQPDLDAVFVLNSDEYHTETALSAIRNGKHVLIEKPMTLTQSDADAIIRAKNEAGVHVMVAYMRRYAPAFTEAAEKLKSFGPIRYVRIRDIIGQNALIIEQTSVVQRFLDIPPSLIEDRKARAERMVAEALGDVPDDIKSAYRLLCGLNSHDLSAMRELFGMPKRVVSAVQWNGGRYIAAIFEYDGFYATFETGVDLQRRFDAHIEIYGDTKQMRIQYDTPYIRHLPTVVHTGETIGDSYRESVNRPTFKDPYTVELEAFYDLLTKGVSVKATPEDYKDDLTLFKMICDALLQQC